MKIVIAGGGIAGNAMLRQLRLRKDITSLKAYERRSQEDASPPGLNVILNHNGMATLKEMDPDLYKTFTDLGWPANNWSARDMAGTVLYHLEDVVASGDASTPALVARWDLIHEATRCDEFTEYSTEVVEVKEATGVDGKLSLSVKLRRHAPEAESDGVENYTEEWIDNIDLLIGADGRYSALRQQVAPSPVYYGPPHVADFRIVVRDQGQSMPALLNDKCPIWRVYNKPNDAKILAEYGMENPSIVAAARGYVRVGLMKLDDSTFGMFGNIATYDDGPIDPILKTGEFLYKLFLPSDEDSIDDTGQLVLQVMKEHGNDAHWARKQQTETVYEALDSKVLFIGDAAGAIYPSLGQGANLSLEDVSVVAAAFPDIKLISKLRTVRREFIKDLSRHHAKHVADADFFDTEISNWNTEGGQWRCDLQKLWSGHPLALRAVTVTSENFAPFGQVICESLDGDVFSPASDAVLNLSQGTPRFYLMKLQGGRPMQADRITRHCRVTQCLGALGSEEDFYLVVHQPNDHPTLEGLKAFRIPPRHFVKLHVGTWHVGPMWCGPEMDRTFMNLELVDTNVVDHDTILFSNLPPGATPGSARQRVQEEDNDKGASLTIPVMAVIE
jgi:2-polyprenyl-6-methoxyphenol hydroxylase-like FAD-dependent oxidoreductase/ureidoglycolate hydrolase